MPKLTTIMRQLEKLKRSTPENVPDNLLPLLRALVEGSEGYVSGAAEDLCYCFTSSRQLCSAPLVLRYLTQLIHGNPAIRRTQVLKLFVAMAQRIDLEEQSITCAKASMPVEIQAEIRSALLDSVAAMEMVLRDDHAAPGSVSAALCVLGLYAPVPSEFAERMEAWLSTAIQNDGSISRLQFKAVERTLASSDSWEPMLEQITRSVCSPDRCPFASPHEVLALLAYLTRISTRGRMADRVTTISILEFLSCQEASVVFDILSRQAELPPAVLAELLARILVRHARVCDDGLPLAAYWLLRLAFRDTRPVSCCRRTASRLMFESHGPLPPKVAIGSSFLIGLTALPDCDCLWKIETNLFELFEAPRDRAGFRTWLANLPIAD